MNKGVYLVLGSEGGDRASVVADLARSGLESEEPAGIWISETDFQSWKDRLADDLSDCLIETYALPGPGADLDLSPKSADIFVVADGQANPADFVETFHRWLEGSDYGIARVITVVDCQGLQSRPEMAAWYDCCIHFSDAVLLSNRKGVSNKWIDEFKERYLKQYYPCLFEFVKKGRVSNPNLVLAPDVRRMSKLFDDAEEFAFDDEEDDDALDAGEEVLAGDPSKDPFLARHGNGQRRNPVPDIGNVS